MSGVKYYVRRNRNS